MIIIKIIIEIPKEFESDYNTDKFKDFFSRVAADIDCNGLCGNYEKETAEMFVKAFENGKIAEEWISCDEKLPDDGDCRFYMCLVENHIDDVPMFCQYEEELGFGFYQDIYDKDTLGFVDTEFKTNDELGYEKVLYWRQIPNAPIEDDYDEQ